MSEYQYYEFQAIDHPLTPDQMAELRAISTRARITPTQFVNVYSYGDFKGDPLKLMGQYFDAFVYLANWGTHRLMLRLPRSLLDLTMARGYAIDDSFQIHGSDGFVIVEFMSDDENGTLWITDDEAASWMPSLLGVRDELAGGDLRALYLGWLAGMQAEMLDDDEFEPSVPPGLRHLSSSLKSLTEFLRIDDDLLTIAAARSPDRPHAPTAGEIERWISELPMPEKDALLIRWIKGDDVHLRAEVQRRFRDAFTPPPSAQTGRRTVAELRSAAEAKADTRHRREAERAEVERLHREREQAATRTRYLDGLIGRESDLWGQVETLSETKRPKDYDEAVRLIVDLHELSVREGRLTEFVERFGTFRARNAKRPSLLKRLERAGLPL